MNFSINQKPNTLLENTISKPEIKLLLFCSRTKLDNLIKKQIRFLVKQNIDWNYLVYIAGRHGVLPLLFNSLNTTCPESIPENTFSKLSSYFQRNVQRNLLITSQLLKILEIFEANNIKVIPFKGPILAFSVYDNPAYRQFCDLDILVHKKDFIRAKELLLLHGYHSYLTKLEQIFVSNHVFQTPMHHSSGMFSVDLHWAIAPRKPRSYSRFNCLWDNVVSISIGGHSISSFSAESTMIIQCLNAAKEHRFNLLLKQICDINETIITYPELSWEIVMYQAQKLGFMRLVLVGLCTTQKLYGTALPEKVTKRISSLPIVEKLAEESKQHLFLDINKFEDNFTKSYIVNKYNFQTTDPRDKLLFMFDKIITPHSEDKEFIRLHPSLYYLYYLIRPIRLIANSKVLLTRFFRK